MFPKIFLPQLSKKYILYHSLTCTHTQSSLCQSFRKIFALIMGGALEYFQFSQVLFSSFKDGGKRLTKLSS